MLATTVTTRARHALMVLSTLGLAAAMWAPARVSASPPTPVEGEFSFPAGFLCPFPVVIQVQGKAKTIQLANGTVIATSPGLTTTVTNGDTGRQVDLNIPGPVLTLATGEAVFVGPSLVLRSTVFGDDTNGLVYTKGRFTFLPGRVPPFSGVGNLTDVCGLLA
jgi:hypothetical protein